MKLLAVVTCILFSATAALAANTPLDGKVFSGKMVAESDKSVQSDELVFKDGKFHSTECDQYGYPEVPYKTSVSGDVVNFEASTTNKNGATMSWKGTVKGDKATAVGSMASKDGSSEKFNFEGTQKR
jgi:hypothetical protein